LLACVDTKIEDGLKQVGLTDEPYDDYANYVKVESSDDLNCLVISLLIFSSKLDDCSLQKLISIFHNIANDLQ
jgi:hypothetical protein